MTRAAHAVHPHATDPAISVPGDALAPATRTARPSPSATAHRSARYRDPVLVATAVSGVLCAIYLLVPRMGNDLSAQIAHADFASRYPTASIDFRWFGGTLPFGYSLWTPLMMAAVGAKVTGAVSTVASVALFTRLLLVGRAPHPLLGGMASTVALAANLIEGRTTFAVGVALGLAALLAIAEPTPWRRIAAVPLVLLAAAASPVAALFLGLCAGVLILTRRIRDGLLLGISSALPTIVITVVFGDSGRQIFNQAAAFAGIAFSLLVMLFVDQRRIRIGAGLSAFVIAVAYGLSSPIGSNSLRLSMLFGLPVLLAYLRWDGQLREWRWPFWVYVSAVAVLGYFVQPFILAGTVGGTGRPATYASYYTPLVKAIDARGPITGRVEVPEITGHWDSAFLDDHVPLARGWLRQLDTKVNKDVFYSGLPTPQNYRAFLIRSAVEYVAVADTRGTFTGGKEKRLIAAGLPYLTKVWSNAHWTLYSVDDSALIVAAPARLVDLAPNRLALTVSTTGNVAVRIRWLRFLALSGPAGACLRPATDPAGNAYVEVRGARPGTYVIGSRLPGGSRHC